MQGGGRSAEARRRPDDDDTDEPKLWRSISSSHRFTTPSPVTSAAEAAVLYEADRPSDASSERRSLVPTTPSPSISDADRYEAAFGRSASRSVVEHHSVDAVAVPHAPRSITSSHRSTKPSPFRSAGDGESDVTGPHAPRS